MDALQRAYDVENSVDEFTENMVEKHIKRLNDGAYSPEVGTQYLALSTNVERIADHYINVAKSVKLL